MKTIQSKGVIKVSLVCCVHGDEPFGKRLFDYYSGRIDQIKGLRLILANEVALEKGERFVDTDLNRCFPGSPKGNIEEQLAYKMLELVQGSRYVLDVHTTTSDIVITPIVANFGEDVKQVLNLCDSTEVVHMNDKIAGSLIGSIRSGVSLEFEEEYAKTDEALEKAVAIIDSLLTGFVRPKRLRKVFLIDQIIPLQPKLPDSTANFKYLQSPGFYPFLVGEKAYTHFQGFAANTVKEVSI